MRLHVLYMQLSFIEKLYRWSGRVYHKRQHITCLAKNTIRGLRLCLADLYRNFGRNYLCLDNVSVACFVRFLMCMYISQVSQNRSLFIFPFSITSGILHFIVIETSIWQRHSERFGSYMYKLFLRRWITSWEIFTVNRMLLVDITNGLITPTRSPVMQ